ncbi:MAG TPA: hypothetical protein VNT75_24940 [Symbiobacteriaceae bacterium]|nr:hypothetical protein [Symbiobacteriaceae bacterium]
MRRLAVLMLALALAAAGCSGARPAAEPAGRPVIVLLDLSGSTETVAPKYREYVQRVIDSLEGGEHLLVVPISSASLTEAAAVDIRFPEYRRFTTNSFTHRRTMTKLRKEALTLTDAVLSAPRTDRSQGTAILDSLLQARDLAGGSPATICIISDMVEDSDLARFESLTEAAIPALLSKAEAGGRLPRFPDSTRVHVAGLGAAGQLEPSQVLTIRTFWEQYFSRAGATLVEYGPDFHSL